MVAVPLAIALIAAATLTPNAFDPAHRVPPAWCFACGEMWLTDVLSNIALFLPLGAALAWRSVRWTRVLLIALGTSFVVEFCQYIGFPSGRSAASADLLTNTLGAVIGALVVMHWTWLCRPPRRQAMLFAMGWAMLSALVLWVTGVAIGSVVPRDQSAEPLTFVASTRTHPPNFGWYGGVVEQARLDAPDRTSLLIRRGWGGPIIVQATRLFDTVTVRVLLRGRDENTAFVPLIYVHVGADSSPAFMIGQYGDDAELRVRRRATTLGLSLPALRLPGAFAARHVGDTTAMTLTASVRTADWVLRGSSQSGVRESPLALNAGMGWSMIQTVISYDSPAAPLAWALWLTFLVAPVGWWSGAAALDEPVPRSGQSGGAWKNRWLRWMSVFAVAPLVVTALVAPRIQGISPLGGLATTIALIAFATSFAAAANLTRQRT